GEMWLRGWAARRRVMAHWRAASSSCMVSSVVRPPTVARGGRFRHDKEPGRGHGSTQVRPCRHQSLRRNGGPESTKLYDALAEKPLRCVGGSQVTRLAKGAAMRKGTGARVKSFAAIAWGLVVLTA